MSQRLFDQELRALREEIAGLIAVIRQAFELTEELLAGQDLSLVNSLVELEQKSDRLENELQKKATTLIALYQPVARDLRLLLVSMNVAHELERIADQCLNISQRLEEARNSRPLDWPAEIPEMVARARDMLNSATGAYLKNREEMALQAIGQDIFLDDLKSEVTNRYLDLINQKAADPGQAVLFVLISRHLEKIGDLAKNIAEESYYLIRGEFIKHQRLPNNYQ